jgi:hypothetical protein
MKQVVQDLQSDQPEVLDVPVPSPAPGTALIRTVASQYSTGGTQPLGSTAPTRLFIRRCH